MHRRVVVFAAAVVGVACDQYTEPPPPRDVQPLTLRSREMARSGIDVAGMGQGHMQRSGMAGVNSDTNDQQDIHDSEMENDSPAGEGGLGPAAVLDSAPGRGSADLDEPEMRNAQRGGRVFRPSDHYFINGVDMGPSWDAAPGTGGPQKLKQKQP